MESYRDRQRRGEDLTWSSSNPKVLDVNSQDGTAVARREGKADIMLSWPADRSASPVINAASSARVSRVTRGALGQADLTVNADDNNDITRVNIKLYLQGQSEEMSPVIEHEGRILVRQNVGVDCVSDQPNYIEAKGEVSESEGFFCNVRYVGPADQSRVPTRAGITVMAKGNSVQASSWGGGTKEHPYSETVLEFQVALQGSLKVDRNDKRNGIRLGRNTRSKSIQVVSLSDLVVDEVKEKNLRVKVTRENQDYGLFTVSFNVIANCTDAFKTEIILRDTRQGGSRVPLSISFDPKD